MEEINLTPLINAIEHSNELLLHCEYCLLVILGVLVICLLLNK